MLRFGAPIFSKDQKAAGAGKSHGASGIDPYELVEAHKEKGYTAAYAPKLSISETKTIKEFRKVFEKENIVFAEVGYWENLMDTNLEVRKKNRTEMAEAFALAEELGAVCVVCLAGSYHNEGNVPDKHIEYNFSQEAFDETVDMARYFIDLIKPKTSFFTYEIYQFNNVDSIDMIAKLIKAVDRKQFGVHLDLTNLINCPRNYWKSGELMKECIKQFGDLIVTAHAKDVRMLEPSITVNFDEVIPGEGMLDIATLVRELHKLPQVVPYMMEHLKTEEEYDRASSNIRNIAANEGILI
jgi:sugar phosphate isomerase/epimerase